MSDLIVCPRCKGEKQIYIQCFPVSLSGWKTCDVCNGAGFIDKIKQAMLEIGKVISEKRRKLRILTRDIAAKHDFTLAEWSDIEQGRSTLENAYRAHRIIHGYLAQSRIFYDLIEHCGFNQRKKVQTFSDRQTAESFMAESRRKAKEANLMAIFEIVERREKIEL